MKNFPVTQMIYDAISSLEQLSEKTGLLEAKANRTCAWTKTIMGIYSEYDNWATSCGEDFAIVEEWHETPTKFCANCGGKTVETK